MPHLFFICYSGTIRNSKWATTHPTWFIDKTYIIYNKHSPHHPPPFQVFLFLATHTILYPTSFLLANRAQCRCDRVSLHLDYLPIQQRMVIMQQQKLNHHFSLEEWLLVSPRLYPIHSISPKCDYKRQLENNNNNHNKYSLLLLEKVDVPWYIPCGGYQERKGWRLYIMDFQLACSDKGLIQPSDSGCMTSLKGLLQAMTVSWLWLPWWWYVFTNDDSL